MNQSLHRSLAILLLLAAPLSTGCATMDSHADAKESGGNVTAAKKGAAQKPSAERFPTALEAGL